jgi:hypothetical protein
MYKLLSIVLSLITEVQVTPENIITGGIAIITVSLIIGARNLFRNKQKVRTESKRSEFLVHIQPVRICWTELGIRKTYAGIVDSLDPNGINLKKLYGDISRISPHLIWVTVIRNGVPTVALVNRSIV